MLRNNNTFKRVTSLLVYWVVYLLPVFWFVALVVSFLETYYYPGVILKHTSVDALAFYLGFAMVGLLRLWAYKQGKITVSKKFGKINYYLIYVFGASYAVFYFLEKVLYINYVFSTFHINPSQLAVPLALSIFAYLISSEDVLLVVLNDPKSLLKIKFPVMVVFLWILFQNFIEVSTGVMREVSFMAKNPNASYDQKMEEKLGKQFYDYVMFVKNNTPEYSKILIPPFPAYPWPQTGNIPYMTYFLYPRTLLNGEEYSSKYDIQKEGIDYVLVVWGETPYTSGDFSHGWPKFDVKAEETVYMNASLEKMVASGDYIYNKVNGKELWGIVKVKKQND